MTRVLGCQQTEGMPLRLSMSREGKSWQNVSKQSLDDLDPRLLSWGMDIDVYTRTAQMLDGVPDVPIWLVEITEAAPPDAVVYTSIVIDRAPDRTTLLAIVERRSTLEPGQVIA